MKNGKKALKVISSVALAVVVGAGIWQVAVRQQSKKYNMITLDTSKLIPGTHDGTYIIKYII